MEGLWAIKRAEGLREYSVVLRVLADLAEDGGLVPGLSTVALNHL